MDEIKYLGKNITVIITNPLGSVNEDNLIYPVNYGYTIDNDKKIDVYVLGVYKPLQIFKGKCIAVLKEINENDKLIITLNDKYYTDEQIEALIEFEEKKNYLLIRNNIFNNGFLELADSLNNCYNEEVKRLKLALTKLVINNINDVDLIEHLLDGFLNIPTEESERLYNFLCDYLDNINKESAKFYKLEYKNIWE